MATIRYIEFDGTEHVIQVKAGRSVMEGASAQGLSGIVAECGGVCACATCQVYVNDEWIDKLSTPKADELAMLEFAANTKPNSRLSCQIEVTDELDGLIVYMPETQY